MISTIDIIKMLKARYNCDSNRQLSKKIGISNTTINIALKGHSLSLDNAFRYAEELGLDKRQVLVGNLCEKKLLNQEGMKLLMEMVGEEYPPKKDSMSRILEDLEKTRKTQESRA